MSNLTILFIGMLTTWRITHLFHSEDGPGDLLARFRRIFGRSFMGKVLDCFMCLSIWIALPVAYGLGNTLREQLWLWPTFSAGACLCQKLSDRQPPLPLYFEEKES